MLEYEYASSDVNVVMMMLQPTFSHLSPNSSMVRASHRRSEGCGFESRLGTQKFFCGKEFSNSYIHIPCCDTRVLNSSRLGDSWFSAFLCQYSVIFFSCSSSSDAFSTSSVICTTSKPTALAIGIIFRCSSVAHLRTTSTYLNGSK